VTRRAFTLPEVLVTLLVIGVVMGVAWSLFGHGVQTSRRIGGTMDAQRTLRARLQGLLHELQGARKLFFPRPGGKSQEGVGYVDRAGKAIMVIVDGTQGERELVRLDLNAGTREVLAQGVRDFRVTIPPLDEGRQAQNVNLTFGLEAEGTEDAEGELQALHMVTSVTLRALQEEHPH